MHTYSYPNYIKNKYHIFKELSEKLQLVKFPFQLINAVNTKVGKLVIVFDILNSNQTTI